MPKGYCIAGIGTGVGKTIFSAIITEALHADYWKPVQCGDLNNSDTLIVKSLVTNSKTIFHPETFQLKEPMSPHAAAAIDGVAINPSDFKLPETDNTIIIEGAGGLMVPLNDTFLIVDLFKQLNLPVILVSRNYLGSINHTILSYEILKQKNIPIAGLVFNDAGNFTTENFIIEYTQLPVILKIDSEKLWDNTTVKKYSLQLKTILH
ncbi:MAG: dethiobiotin synthase [Bacteroidetes bacterium]|nr:dethiobiotin synthase [Bacteroidota bacterium]MBK8488248.1 dethiobiotin synthase [Bacteroidota bacterium]